MKWQTGSVDDDGNSDEGVKVTLGTDYSGKLDPSPKKKNVRVEKKGTLFKKAEVPLIILGAAVLAFIVFFLFFKPVKNSDNLKLPVENVVEDIAEQRIIMLEERLSSMEERSKEADALKKRYDQMEATLFMKIDLLTKKIERLEDANKKPPSRKVKKQGAAPAKTATVKKKAAPSRATKKKVTAAKPKPVNKPVKKVAGETKPAVKTVYHMVRKGENLYRIGLKYGLKMEALRKLNKLGPDMSIYPGQKLLVKP